MIRKTFSKFNDPEFVILRNNINKYTDSFVDISKVSHIEKNIKTNSWFSNLHTNYSYTYKEPKINFTKCEKKISEKRTIKLNMELNNMQKLILDKWFNSFNIMYNQTIIFIRKHLSYCNIYKYKKLYNTRPKYFENCKNIKKTKDMLNKERVKYSILLTKLEKLLIKVNKTNNDHKNIVEHKINISKIKINITKINIELNKYLKDNVELKKNYDSYVNLKKHIDKFLDFKYIRTNYLKKIRENIAFKYSCYNNDIKYKIHSHSLDGAIKKACANYKTCIENLLQNNLKRFRVKCKNIDNKIKFVEIDSTSFNGNATKYIICEKILGDIKYTYNNKEYTLTTKQTSSIYYNGQSYTLLIPVSIENPIITAKKPYIALDGGVRDFLKGIDNSSIISYGNNTSKILNKYYEKIDKLNSISSIQDNAYLIQFRDKLLKEFMDNLQNYKKIKYVENKIKEIDEKLNYTYTTIEYIINNCKKIIENNKKILKNTNIDKNIQKIKRSILFNENRINKLLHMSMKEKEKYEKYINYNKINKSKFIHQKIKWKIDDLHWKTARELSENYETIILGKIDSKEILQNINLNKGTKRILQTLSHYKFRERLVYKAFSLGSKVIVQNEKYTTKTCSLCGHYNEWIKGEHIIKCKGCKKEYNRDNNGALNILYKSLI